MTSEDALEQAIAELGLTLPQARELLDIIERRQQQGWVGKREITPTLLQRVAEVYRGNINRAPTAAVGRHFGVKSRMASGYVQRARAAGYLPPTKQGQKRA